MPFVRLTQEKMWKTRIRKKIRIIRETTVFIEFDESENRKRPDQTRKKTDWFDRHTRFLFWFFFFSHSMVDFGPLAVISHCFRYCSCCRLFVDSNRKCSSLCKWCLVTCDLVTLAYDAADMRHNSVDIVDTKVSSTRKYVPLIFL